MARVAEQAPSPPVCLESVGSLICLQFVVGADGKAARDTSGRVVPAWPDVADALLSVSPAFYRDDEVLRAAVNVARGPNKLTRLMAAVAAHDLGRITRLVELGADVNAVAVHLPGLTRKGGTALSLTFLANEDDDDDDEWPFRDRGEAINRLLAAGASVNTSLEAKSVVSVSSSPFRRLCKHPSVDSKLGLDLGIAYSMPEIICKHLCAADGWDENAFRNVLYNYHGCENIDADAKGWQALCKHPLVTMEYKLACSEMTKSVAWLRELAMFPGAPVDTVLWCASSLGVLDLVKDALSKGGDANAANFVEPWMCCLRSAAVHGHSSVVRVLAKDPNVNKGDALLAACMLGLEGVAVRLLDADPDLISTYCFSFDDDDDEISAMDSPLTAAALYSGDVHLVDTLLARGAIMDGTEPCTFHILAYFCLHDWSERDPDLAMLRVLIERGANSVFHFGEGDYFVFPGVLYAACACEQYDIVVELLTNHAALPGCSTGLNPPPRSLLHMAAGDQRRGNATDSRKLRLRAKAVKLLIERGASTTAVNDKGKTARDVATPKRIRDLFDVWRP